ncbi:recombination regulator RecX [Paenalkalicoccus suaedae]|uniref:Regulatory protein RecX n=1 Tax=Paenalkalicoccus suaedae TaxID=2592382 RepID=A0A859FBG0_9BACI|nr:recombination regulator RecX [Paenalkalicoccus suaedae]QKS70609.1 recombination regulator RecX [Paenalkalicoccus suaedae]
MYKITKVTAAKKTKQRYHIHLMINGQDEYAFSVSEDLLIKEELVKGKELSKEDINRLKGQDEIDKVYQKALGYLAFRMRSEKELRQYIKDQEMPADIIDSMVEKLIALDFLQDERFAEAFVRTKRDQSTKGPLVIRQELKQKGIADNVIEAAMAQYPREEQLDNAITLVEKKQNSYGRESQRSKEQKLMQFLIQRGFDHTLAAEALREATIEEDDDVELEALRQWAEKAWRKYEGKEPYERNRKIKEFLYRKGFSQDTIQAWFDEQE